ncbi:MAG: SRPBCC family protein [Austwickia sp.]|nr:SRPBCC family protein [Actinomycetota bacterium]MCB1254104.1 SRPBCC family protein [Austwickia sp.]MCO5308233.1 SRPBCC family protein [Austwickia sp.]
MEIHHYVDVSATPDTVWEVLTDVVGWARWMPDIAAVEMVDRSLGEAYADAYVVARVNSTPSVWYVGPGVDRTTLAWENSCGDCDSRGEYRLESLDEHTTRTHISVHFTGASCPVAGVLGRYSLRDGVMTQAAALRSRCQLGAAGHAALSARREPVGAGRRLTDRSGESRSTSWARRQHLISPAVAPQT